MAISPTVESPNPENKEGFKLAIGYAKECGADLIVEPTQTATELVFWLRMTRASTLPFTGNQVGTLLSEYILSALAEKGCGSKGRIHSKNNKLPLI